MRETKRGKNCLESCVILDRPRMKRTLYEEDLYPIIEHYYQQQGYETTAHYYVYGTEHDVVAVHPKKEYVVLIEAKRKIWLGKWEKCFHQAYVRRVKADKSYTAFPLEKARKLINSNEKMEKVNKQFNTIGILGVKVGNGKCVILREAKEREPIAYPKRKIMREVLRDGRGENQRPLPDFMICLQ